MAATTPSSNPFTGIIIRESADDGSDFSNPAADYRRLFLGEDGSLHLKDSAGTVTDIGVGTAATTTFDPTGLANTDATDVQEALADHDAAIASAGGAVWEAAGEAWTYASADDPTYTLTIATDLTTKYSAGMRVRVSQSTGGTKYFIITKVAYGAPNTTLTLYGGTDYNLESEAISSPYYSSAKAPYGFPLDPTKWTAEFTDTAMQTQATPTVDVWYNIGTSTLSIPIGVWRVYYEVGFHIIDAAEAPWGGKVTLSTANNSETDASMSARISNDPGKSNLAFFHRERHLTLTTKTSYYLNALANPGVNLDNMYFRGDNATTVIRAICAYL